MRTIQTVIEDETYKKLLALSENDKRTLSYWVKEAIEKELKSREAAQTQPNDFADNVVG